MARRIEATAVFRTGALASNPRRADSSNSADSSTGVRIGAAAPNLPEGLQAVVHKGQGHRVFADAGKVVAMEAWFAGFERNRIYGPPQLAWAVGG